MLRTKHLASPFNPFFDLIQHISKSCSLISNHLKYHPRLSHYHLSPKNIIHHCSLCFYSYPKPKWPFRSDHVTLLFKSPLVASLPDLVSSFPVYLPQLFLLPSWVQHTGHLFNWTCQPHNFRHYICSLACNALPPDIHITSFLAFSFLFKLSHYKSLPQQYYKSPFSTCFTYM